MTTPGQLPLNEQLSVTLDGSGNGTVQLRPYGETWYPALVSVKVAGPVTNEATARVYCGQQASDQAFVDGTLSGSTGDSTDHVAGYVIARTQTPYIWVVWTGGDAGKAATAVVSGTKKSP